MKKVTYDLEDLKRISDYLNIISGSGINIDQAKAITEIVFIIDNKHYEIEEVEALQKTSDNEKEKEVEL